MKEAVFYKALENKKVQCNLCPHHCIIQPDDTGICQVRKNIDGILYSLVYEKPIAQSVDPIEKKPLFHFYPGTKAYSIATVGCNLKCMHCQNYDISQQVVSFFGTSLVSADQIVTAAIKSDATSIAYTYTEPTIFYEYAYDIAELAHKKNLKNVFVTNGFTSLEALDHIAPLIDAANIDLKAMSDSFYKKVCKARLQPVLDAIVRYYKHGIWIEITTLLIPGYNDSEQELQQIAEFIYSIDKKIPWHVTAFHPTYKLTDAEPTTSEILEKAVSIGQKAGLNYIYQGNLLQGEDTFCPKCHNLLIKRRGFHIMENNISKQRCPRCNYNLNKDIITNDN